jgi:hypothetical protein
MDKQTEKAFKHVSVFLEEVCTMTKDMPAEREKGTGTSPHLAEIRQCVAKVRGLREDIQMLQRGVDKTVQVVEGLVPHIEQTRELAGEIKAPFRVNGPRVRQITDAQAQDLCARGVDGRTTDQQPGLNWTILHQHCDLQSSSTLCPTCVTILCFLKGGGKGGCHDVCKSKTT